jgi:hypothetical protein
MTSLDADRIVMLVTSLLPAAGASTRNPSGAVYNGRACNPNGTFA